ncbi:MAG: hypothetical protein GY850_05575, partial [bacterium]|nr:hypothetical protein [bacterium]
MAFKKLISTVSVLILILLGLTGSLWAETVTVTVQTDEESALSGRLVYAYTDTDTYTGVTRTADSNGLALFESDDFSAGNYKFRTDLLNIQFWSDEITIPGDTEIDLVIEMERVEVLLSMAGSPLENINIYLFNESGTYLSQNLNTTADGTVAFDLPVGHNFKFRADILSTYYWSEIVTITGGGTNQVPFNAGGGLLEITLKEDTVTPMAGIKLYLYNTSGGYLGQLSTTDAAGIASFVVAAGTYRVRADYLGYQFWSLDTEVTADRAIEFIIPHRVVTLTVNNSYQSNPTGLEGVKVYLFTAGGTYQGQYANTDANGQVSFRLPEQAYKARVDYLSRHYWSTDFVWVDQEINIDHAQAEISVTGAGLPVSGLAVYLFSGSGAYLNRYETTDGAGKVTYGLPAEGTFKFRVTYEGSQYWTDEMTLTANEVNPIDLSVGGGTFALTVLKRPGVPLPDALCYLYNESGTYLNINATTDQNGQVSFDLADGTYKFRVDQLGYQFWSDLFLVPDVLAADFEITHQMITITVNDSYQGADTGLSGVPVYLFTSGEAYQGIMQNTDGNGQIILDLPDEAYKVRVDYLNQQFWSTDFTGQDRSVDIGMAEAEVTVSGAGLPAEGINVYVFS